MDEPGAFSWWLAYKKRWIFNSYAKLPEGLIGHIHGYPVWWLNPEVQSSRISVVFFLPDYVTLCSKLGASWDISGTCEARR